MTAAIWTAIGSLAATSVGTLFYLGSGIDALAARMDAGFARIDAGFARVDAKFDRVDASSIVWIYGSMPSMRGSTP